VISTPFASWPTGGYFFRFFLAAFFLGAAFLAFFAT